MSPLTIGQHSHCRYHSCFIRDFPGSACFAIRRRRCNSKRVLSARSTDATPNASSEETSYNDTWSDIAFIALCRKAYGNIAGWQSPRSWADGKETYAGMVEVSRALMKVSSQAQPSFLPQGVTGSSHA